MSHWIRTSLTLSSVTALVVAISAGSVHASGWGSGPVRPLYPASSSAAPYAAARPIVAAQPVQSGGCNSCAAAPAPCNRCAQTLQPTTVNFAPRTWFRSRWVRVPVTAYRPVTVVNQTTNPTNCAPVTQLQPCSMYRWQVQRVPTYRPLLSWLTWWRRPLAPAYLGAYTAPAAHCSTCVPTAAAFAPASNCETCAPAAAQAPNSAPYYQPPAAAPATTVPGSRAPADLRPRLRPSEVDAPVPGVTTRRVNPTAGSNNSSVRSLPHRPRARQPYSNVVPIPDTGPAQTPRESAEDHSIPQLLSPRNHTASLRDTPVWELTRAHTSQRAAAPERRPATNSAATRPQPERWDDSGWRSAR